MRGAYKAKRKTKFQTRRQEMRDEGIRKTCRSCTNRKGGRYMNTMELERLHGSCRSFAAFNGKPGSCLFFPNAARYEYMAGAVRFFPLVADVNDVGVNGY